MTIFELLLYACLTSHSLSGSYIKTCDWHSQGGFYTSKERCEEQGKFYRGADIQGDVRYADATNKYEDVNCIAHRVWD